MTSIYLTPDEHARPKFTASEAVNLYINIGHEIFDKDFWHRIQSLVGLTEEKFPVANLEKNLKKLFWEHQTQRFAKTLYDNRL